MSLLRNPDFESGLAPWEHLFGGSVDLKVIGDTHKARTGSHYLSFRVNEAHTSVSQDIHHVTMPSVTALAYVRAESSPVSGWLTIWDAPGATNQKNVSARILNVGQTWTQIVATLGRENPASGTVRIELYLDTIDAFMWIDSVTAF
jgi:hypothetical protein